jgi:hypothetical protein
VPIPSRVRVSKTNVPGRSAMPGPSPFDRPTVGVFQRSFAGRSTGPLGCLLAILLCPVGLVIAIVTLLVSLFVPRRRVAFAPSTPVEAAREEALRRLVRAFASDDSFTAEDARQAGTLVAGGATVDDLLADALDRRWIEVKGERLVVTRRGREATT